MDMTSSHLQQYGSARSITVRLAGRLDASTGNAVLHELLAAHMPGHVLVVDLSGVESVEPAGAEILQAVRRQARIAGGDVELIGAAPWAQALLAGLPHR